MSALFAVTAVLNGGAAASAMLNGDTGAACGFLSATGGWVVAAVNEWRST